MRTALLIVALFIAGCSKPSRQQNAPSESKPEQAHDAKSPDNLLHIESEMMRDLRITTSTVEQRRGGEGVSLLGEVTVNEDSYSQVGAPIAARLVKISAGPGQHVTKGEQLAVLQSTEIGKARSESITAQARLQLARTNS